MQGAAARVFRSAIVVSLGLITLLAPLAGASAVANAQGSAQPQVTVNVDSPGSNITVTNGQRILVGGWAAATGGRGSGISSVDIYLESPSGATNWLGTARLDIDRQDVARTTNHPEWAKSGFNFEWTPREVAQGPQTLQVVARASSGQSVAQAVQLTGCGCGSNFQPSLTNPAVRRIGTIGWEIDTGGPGVFIQRDILPFFFW